MSEVLFDRLAALIEERTSFNRLEARGTLRIALREAGLASGALTRTYAEAVVEKILPRELHSRGISDAETLCASLVEELRGMEEGVEDAHRPEALFERLGSA